MTMRLLSMSVGLSDVTSDARKPAPYATLNAALYFALGVNATNALVVSQVVLSIALPLPMIALLIFTRRVDIMGQFANGRLTTIAAMVATAVVLLLNVVLILQMLSVPIPGLSSN